MLLNSVKRMQMQVCTRNFVTKIPSAMINDPTKNKYQHGQMLFFADGKQKDKKVNINKPRTITEIKKLQNFVKTQKTEQGKSLNESIQKMARRDESFNDFLKNFKAKNE